MCKVLGVSRSGYYEWLREFTGPQERNQHKYKVMRSIEDIFKAGRGYYGAPKIHFHLCGLGFDISPATVSRYMQEMGLRSKIRRRYKVTTISDKNKRKEPNHLMQIFDAKSPNEVWMSDITYIDTAEGDLYLASILDLYSRKIVGWSLESNMQAEIVVNALDAAMDRQNHPREVLFHSDQGTQYTSDAVQSRLKLFGFVQSMSRKGNCWDNAPKESFFHLLKTELVYQERFKTRAEAKAKIFDWIECFYNRERIHSAIGYKTPLEKENEFMQAA